LDSLFGGVGGVGLPTFGDDVFVGGLGASLRGDLDGDGELDWLVAVLPPDSAPGVLEGLVSVATLLLDVHPHNVAVDVLDQQRQVVGVAPLLHMEGDLFAILALDPTKLHVDDARLPQLLLLALLGHGGERRAG